MWASVLNNISVSARISTNFNRLKRWFWLSQTSMESSQISTWSAVNICFCTGVIELLCAR